MMDLGTIAERRLQPWKLWVCFGVCMYLALNVATRTIKPYHWLLLLLIPGAALAAERGRRLFADWAPLFLTWIAYDRLRWVQPLLLPRVWVSAPYEVERALFGWAAGGEAPAHAASRWLDAASISAPGFALSALLQAIYFSHVVAYPLLFLTWWLRGRSRGRDRERFATHVWAFALLNALGFVGYVLLPVAPPWWVSLYGTAQPSQELAASAPLAEAIHGALTQRTIATAPNWFAAFPSLHGAYPVLLFILAWPGRNRTWLAGIALYGSLMWASTVVLNLHYVVDLVAGALLAACVGAYYVRPR
jgi:inositol phosphorylceramide synthase catalytic subunit